jgi:tRNA U55 pseudouridine synthase TruB
MKELFISVALFSDGFLFVSLCRRMQADETHGPPSSAGVNVVLVNKPPGITPLAALEQLRLDQPDEFHVGIKLSYAGRLDPLARGLLVCLAGPTGTPLVLQKEIETKAKIYEFQVYL